MSVAHAMMDLDDDIAAADLHKPLAAQAAGSSASIGYTIGAELGEGGFST